MIKKSLFLLTLTFFLFGGAGQILANNLPGPGVLPDSPLYVLKIFFESIGTFFTFGEKARAERFLNLAEKRLAESMALAEKNKLEFAQRATNRYQEQLNLALVNAEEARKKGLNIDELLMRISEATLYHQSVLMDIYERVPEQSKEAIEKVMEQSMLGHEQALKGVSGEKQEEVLEKMERKRQEIRERFELLRGKEDEFIEEEPEFEKEPEEIKEEEVLEDDLAREEDEDFEEKSPGIVDGFCGWSTLGDCLSDAGCMLGGCSSQVCQSIKEEPVITTCEFRECYVAQDYGVSCKCVSNKCQWAN